MKSLKISPSLGGWVFADWESGRCWARFAHGSEGTLELREIHSADPDNLRAIPVGRIRSACTMSSGGYAWAIEQGLGQEFDLTQLGGPPRVTARIIGPRVVLQRPAGKGLDDDFFRLVAQAYQGCVALGLPPNKTLGEDAGVAPTTAATWVAEARRRGHLPPGQKGRVTA